MAVTASGVRISWPDLPGHVRTWVQDTIGGGAVVAHRSQTGGFSPGTADRLLTADGRRAFVKAVSPAQNEQSPDMHRREARVVAQLPPSPHWPRLLGHHDDEDWVVLVFADVDGHPPTVPWSGADIEAAMAALTHLAHELTPSPVPQLGPLAEQLREPFGGWARLREDRPRDLDDWTAGHLDQLVALADQGLGAIGGDTVVHNDIRADNLVVGPDGQISVVDWPWAANGADWVDRLMLIINIDLYGGHDPERLIAAHLGHVAPAHATAVIAGLCGFFTAEARRPAPSGLPTVRAFQAAQAASTLAWLRRRLDG